MANYFLDTSACVKFFDPEIGSDQVETLFREHGATLYISRLGQVEIVSALALKARIGRAEVSDVVLARKRLLAEIKNRRLRVLRVLDKHYRSAEKSLLKYGIRSSFRSADALQLAIAMNVVQLPDGGTFVCADRALLQIALQEGLTCLDPEHP